MFRLDARPQRAGHNRSRMIPDVPETERRLWADWLKRLPVAVADALFPLRCISCGHGLNRGLVEKDREPSDCRTADRVFREVLALYICGDCLSGDVPVAPPLCSMCGIMFESRSGRDHRCGHCIRQPRLFARARSAGLHRGGLKKALHGLKYGKKMQLVRPLGRLMVDTLRQYWEPGDVDAVVPVPLHSSRLRKRGFNQAALLVREMKKRIDETDGWIALPTATDKLLIRNRRTRSQTGLGKSERVKNIRNAFSVPSNQAVSGKRLLLVDDVLTTGATVEECAGVLLDAGALRVDVLTLSRAE